MMYVLRNERDMKRGAAGVVGGMILIVSLSCTPHLILYIKKKIIRSYEVRKK